MMTQSQNELNRQSMLKTGKARGIPLPMTKGLGSTRPLWCFTLRSGPLVTLPSTCWSGVGYVFAGNLRTR